MMSARDWLRRGVRAARQFSGLGRARNCRSLRVAIVLPVTAPAANLLTRIGLEILGRHGAKGGLEAPPHLSLKLGFLTQDPGALADFLAEFAQRVQPLPIRLCGTGSFDDSILYADVQPNAALEHLRQTLLAELAARFGIQPHAIEGAAFHPHVTLAHSLSRKAFDAERALLRHVALDTSFIAQEIALWAWLDTHWIALHRTNLGGASVPTSPHNADALVPHD